MTRRRTASILATTMLGTMDSNALVPVIALYAASLGAALWEIGIIVGLYSAVHAPANLLFGRIADRWGRVRPLRIGLLWDAGSMLLYAFAGNPLMLALARISHGIGGGLVGPSTMALTSDGVTEERRGRAMALYGISIAIAVIIGTGIAGPITARLGFAPLFYVLAVGLVVGFVISLAIRELPRTGTARAAWGQVLAYVKSPGPAAGYGAIFTLYFLLGAFTALVPLHLEDELGYTRLEIGLSFTAFAVLSLLLHYPAGILSDRYGPAVPALVGLVATSAAMATLPVVRDVTSILVVIALFGIGHGFVFPSSSALVTRGADPSSRGLVTGLFYSLLVAGVAVGAPSMAAAANARDSYAFGIWASAWFGLLGIAFLARFVLSQSHAVSMRRHSVTPNGRR